MTKLHRDALVPGDFLSAEHALSAEHPGLTRPTLTDPALESPGLDGPGLAGALRHVPLDQIRPNPKQPRIIFAGHALEQLAESIRVVGVLTPLLVRRDETIGGYVLIAGERRLRAAGLAGLTEVPVWVRDDVDAQEQLELALVENIQREDLDPIETAEAYKRLIDHFGLTQSEVAARVGKERATVANAVRLLRLPDFALAALRAGEISAGHAKALLAVADDATLRSALEQVTSRQLSVRATEKLVKSLLRPKARPRSQGRAEMVRTLGEQLSASLQTRVTVEPRSRGQRGRIVIDYFSHEQLGEIVRQIREEQGLSGQGQPGQGQPGQGQPGQGQPGQGQPEQNPVEG